MKYVANGVNQTQLDYAGHDKNGNIGSEVRAVRLNGTWTPVVKPYTYDGFDRLKTGPDGSLSDTYEYTPGGDITRGGSYYDPTYGATYESYGYNNASLAHAATSILPSKKFAFAIRDLAYDNAGRLRTSTLQTSPAQQTVYTFNAGDCLRRIAHTVPGTSTSYTTDQWCDAEGNRVVRSSMHAGTRKRMVPFLGLGEIRPDDGVGLFVWRLPVNGTVSVEEGRKLSDGTFVGGAESGFVMSDIRGSVVAETNLQAVPAIVEAHEYDPYGDERPVGNLPRSEHGYVGGEREPFFEVYTYGVRTYDPSLRRWLSQEPEWLGQGPIGLNAYQYAGNNPTNATDPDGRVIRYRDEALGAAVRTGQHSEISRDVLLSMEKSSTVWSLGTRPTNEASKLNASRVEAMKRGGTCDAGCAARIDAFDRNATSAGQPRVGFTGNAHLNAAGEIQIDIDIDLLVLTAMELTRTSDQRMTPVDAVVHEAGGHGKLKLSGAPDNEVQPYSIQIEHVKETGRPPPANAETQLKDATRSEGQTARPAPPRPEVGKK